MSAPQTLVQAALHRLAARLGSGLADVAAGLAGLAQDAPERMRREWDLFVEEVELEARRLEDPHVDGHAAHAASSSGGEAQETGDPQQQVDHLRALVARVARQIEDQA